MTLDSSNPQPHHHHHRHGNENENQTDYATVMHKYRCLLQDLWFVTQESAAGGGGGGTGGGGASGSRSRPTAIASAAMKSLILSPTPKDKKNHKGGHASTHIGNMRKNKGAQGTGGKKDQKDDRRKGCGWALMGPRYL